MTSRTLSQWQLRAAFAAAALGHVRAGGARLHHARGRLPRGQRGRAARAGRRRRAAGVHQPGDRRTARRDPRRHARRSCGQVARIFGALGMHPVGFYDLREAAASAVPVVSTAFRPVDGEELARNPFRVFTSMLTPADPRFFDADLRARLETFLAGRRAVPPGAARPRRPGRSRRANCPRRTPNAFLQLAVQAFELSTGADRPGLVRDPGTGLRRRRRHRRRAQHPHQPPHPARPGHRRALPAHDRARHRDDRHHPGPAALGRPRRAAAPDLLPRARRAPRHAHRRRRRDQRGPAGALRRGRGARHRPHPRGPRPLRPAARPRSTEQAARRPGTPTAATSPARLWAEHFPATERRLAARGLALLHLPRRARPAAGRQPAARRPRRPAGAGLGPRRTHRLRGLPAPLRGRHLPVQPHRRGLAGTTTSRAPPTTAPGCPAPSAATSSTPSTSTSEQQNRLPRTGRPRLGLDAALA